MVRECLIITLSIMPAQAGMTINQKFLAEVLIKSPYGHYPVSGQLNLLDSAITGMTETAIFKSYLNKIDGKAVLFA